MTRLGLSPAEAHEIRGQMAAARIAGDHKTFELCRRALSGLDSKACVQAKILCRIVWGHR
jgi:hypothetical protein